jgi:hypothetical protein
MRTVLGEALGIIGLAALLFALTAVIVTSYQGVRRRWERAKTAGAFALVFVAAGIVSACSSGLTMPAEPAPQETIARGGDPTTRAQEPGPRKEERPTEVPQEPEVLDAPDAPAVVAVVAGLVIEPLYCKEFGELTSCEAGNPTTGSRGYMVLISPSSGSVELVEVYFYGYTAADARFLGEIVAALKMREGNDTEAARRWVMAHARGAVANPTGKKFGGLAYSIEGVGEMRWLIVSEV